MSKFAESQRLDPSPGTLLNLANCYEKTDRPATAWATYREGASSASATGRQDLLATAQRHADFLYPTLPRLSLSVTPGDGALEVTLDGVSVGRAEWGIAVPVDPGDHTIEAHAPHFVPWNTKVTIGKEPTTTTVTIPALEAAAEEPSPPPGAPPPVSPPVVPPPRPADDSTGSAGSTQRTLGIVAGAGGIVGLGLGIAFSVNAKSMSNGSLADCESSNPNLCTQAGVNERNNALSSGNIATVAFVVGGVALAGGVVLWLTAPSRSGASTGGQAASLALLPTLGGGALRATW